MIMQKSFTNQSKPVKLGNSKANYNNSIQMYILTILIKSVQTDSHIN